MRQFNPHRESRVPQIAPVPFSKRVHAKKRTIAGDAKGSEGDIENLENASTESGDSISKSLSPVTPVTPGPPGYTETAGGTLPPTQTATSGDGANSRRGITADSGARPFGSTGRVRIRNRNNLHVLGERLNIDAQQLRDLIEEDQRGVEDMEMPVLRAQRSGRTLATHGPGRNDAATAAPAGTNGSVPILNRGQGEKEGVKHVEEAYGRTYSQSPFDDKAAAAGPVIRVHSPHDDFDDDQGQAAHAVEARTVSSPSINQHQSTGTDSVDSLPYAQPSTARATAVLALCVHLARRRRDR